MAKRKCKMSAEELGIHEQAVKLRKMTDKQLVGILNKLINEQKDNSQPPTPTREDKSMKVPSALDSLLHDLSEGSVKGIGKATTEKIIEYCLDRGYSKFGLYEMG